MARRGRSANQVLLQQSATGDELQASGGYSQKSLVGGAQLSGTEGRTGPRPLRGAVLARLAPPRGLGADGLRLSAGRAAAPPQKSGDLTLPLLREQLQSLLACWCAH